MTRSLIVGVHDTGDSRNALVRATEWTPGPASQRAGFDLVRHTQVRAR